MDIKLTKTWRIDIETLERLTDMKTQTGTSENELVNKMIKLGIDSFLKQEEINNAIEKAPIRLPVTEPVIALLSEQKKEEQTAPIRTLGADLLGEGDPDEYKV